MKGEAVVVCGDEGDGDEADELWFSESCGARPCGVCKEGRSEGASETRAPRRNEGDRSLAEMKYHVHRSTDVYLACESACERGRVQ